MFYKKNAAFEKSITDNDVHFPNSSTGLPMQVSPRSPELTQTEIIISLLIGLLQSKSLKKSSNEEDARPSLPARKHLCLKTSKLKCRGR